MMNKPITKQLIKLTINGIEKEVVIRNADTVLHLLREGLGLTGAESGCNNGDCGACTVLIDGLPINACHILAIEASGKEITTIEGLSNTLIQNSFIEQWAIQCGYCTPGFILNSYALIQQHPDATDEMIDDWLDSNICRCTGYEEIKTAIKNLLETRKISG